MIETGIYVVQSVRRVPEEQRYDHRLLQSVRGTPCEPNLGDAWTDLPEPTPVIPQLPNMKPAPTKTYHCDNRGTRNAYIRKTDLEKFGYIAGCPACEANVWAGTHRRMQKTICRRNGNGHIHSDPSQSNTCERSGTYHQKCARHWRRVNPSSSSGPGQHRRVRCSDQERLGSNPEGDRNADFGSGGTRNAQEICRN